MPRASLLRLGLRAALVSSLAGAVLGSGCKGARNPECPTGAWCGARPEAEARRQTPEQWLGCPKYVTWGGAPDAKPAPLADMAPRGEGSLDLEETRKRRAVGETEACCYRWYAICPGAKPLSSADRPASP